MSQNESQKESTGNNVLAEVADVLKGSSGEVRKRLVNALTERELVKRVDILDKALLKRKDFVKEVDKIRPEKQYDLEGNEMPGNFTKAQHDQRKQAKEKLTKFDKLLENAFNGQDFDKLSQMLSGGKSDSSEGEKSGE